MTIHSSIIRIIIRVIGYFRLLASTRTYVLRYVVRGRFAKFRSINATTIYFHCQDSISSLPSFKILESNVTNPFRTARWKKRFDRVFLLRYLFTPPLPPLARSNAKKWNEINADNCRQQLAAVPACRPTSLTGLRVARSCFAADRFHRHSLCSQLQSGKLSSRSAEQRNKPSHAFPE